jgi:hypothetical protein
MDAIVRTFGALLLLAVAVAACGDDEADPLEPVEQPVLDIDVSRQSVCLLVTEDLPEEVEELPTIGCDVPHTHEIRVGRMRRASRSMWPPASRRTAASRSPPLAG